MLVIPPLSLWASYEYIGPGDDYHPAHEERQGGPMDGPYIWADDSMWTIDTPETPHSILALLFYQKWDSLPPADLENAKVEFHLRGDELDLMGAQCYFWILSDTPTSTRWHFTSEPLQVPAGTWGTKQQITLVNEPEKWHQSFAASQRHARSLDQALMACTSFGFSFMGFSGKVRGKLALSAFSITTQNESDPSWPYATNFDEKAADWLTVSKQQKRQLPVSQGKLQLYKKDSAAQLKNIIYCRDDFLSIPNTLSFCYLTYIRAEHSTQGADLRNAYLYVDLHTEDFDPKGGTVHFFVEHAASNTRWVYRGAINMQQDLGHSLLLEKNEKLWFRLTGEMPFDEVMAGDRPEAGYTYWGFMAVNVQDNPTGLWGICHLSLGPRIEE